MNTKNTSQQVEAKAKTSMNFGAWGWGMIIYSMLLYFSYAGWGVDGLNIFTTAFGKEHGWDPAALLALVAPGQLMGVVGTGVFGQLTLKKGPKVTIIVCLVMTAVSIGWFGRISSLTEFGISLALINFFGAGFGFVAPGTLINNWFPNKKGLALAWATMGFPLSTAIFVPIIAVMFSELGIANSTSIWAIILVLLAVIAHFVVKNNPEERGCSPDNEQLSREEIEANLKELEGYSSSFTLKRLLKDKDMWLISLGFGCLWMVTVGIVAQLVPRLESIGYSQSVAVLLLSAAAVCALPGSLLWGWLDQKYSTRLAGIVYAAMYIITLIIMIVQTNNIFVTFIAIVMVGLGLGGIKNLVTSIIASVYGRYDFAAAFRIVLPITVVVRTLAFAVLAIALQLGTGFSGAYTAFIGIDIIGLILVYFITSQCKGKVG
ncbi:MAG: major facilitator superfamily 1 [Firmicutes bacterium]|nr:major facilitator superfamily 1 [Bacillota bacterium]